MIAPAPQRYQGRALRPQVWRDRLWSLAQGLWITGIGIMVLAVLLSR